MSLHTTNINISWTQTDIISDEFLWHGAIMDRATWLRPSVQDWVDEYRSKGHTIELNEWWVPWLAGSGVVDRIEGVTFTFADPAIAVLFKLTFGGK